MHQHEFPIQKMCRVFKVSRGGYYARLVRPLSQREKENLRLVERIKVIHAETDENYGSPRMTTVLWDEKFTVSRPRLARLMRKNGIRAKTRRKFKVTTNSDHKYPISPNLLKQDFTVYQPGKVWASDITCIPTREGWLVLTVIIDLYNRQIVGWAMNSSPKATETTIPA